MSIYDSLNPEQLAAVKHDRGPLLILAGAGSGKTTVIVNRIANIVKYGNAYKSNEVAFEPSERDIRLMKAYLDNPETPVMKGGKVTAYTVGYKPKDGILSLLDK